MASRRATSCFWALYCRESEFHSRDAKRGFRFARQIAGRALERREALADYPDLPEPITAEEVAADEMTTAAYVRRLVTIARKERFGSKSDRSIRREVRPKTRPTTCAECGADLPPPRYGQPGRPKRYCDEHATPAARTRRARRISEWVPLPVASPSEPAEADDESEVIRCALCNETARVATRAEGRQWWQRHRAACPGTPHGLTHGCAGEATRPTVEAWSHRARPAGSPEYS